MRPTLLVRNNLDRAFQSPCCIETRFALTSITTIKGFLHIDIDVFPSRIANDVPEWSFYLRLDELVVCDLNVANVIVQRIVRLSQACVFTDALRKRSKAAGFMRILLLQRICSSFSSGRATAEKILRQELLDDEEASPQMEGVLENITPEEGRHLRTIVDELSRPEARDPKTAAVQYFLTEHRSEGKTWRELGCIIFSQ